MGAPIKHGECYKKISKLYQVWAGMIQRTGNVKAREYKYYGLKGIKVCEEWRTPGNFFKWARENGYKEGLEIDRIKNNLGYNPSNCRFVTKTQNLQNKTKRQDYGIYLRSCKRGWFVKIQKNGTRYYGGGSMDKEVARQKRDELQAKLNT